LHRCANCVARCIAARGCELFNELLRVHSVDPCIL
jgi:hypothetical protein